MKRERPEEEIDLLLKQQLDILYHFQKYQEEEEFPTITSKIADICKSFNEIRIRLIMNKKVLDG
jgi:hypothetical protein